MSDKHHMNSYSTKKSAKSRKKALNAMLKEQGPAIALKKLVLIHNRNKKNPDVDKKMSADIKLVKAKRAASRKSK